MPDLMGAFSSRGLSASHRAGLASMQRGVLAFRGGCTEVASSNGSSIAAVRHHPNDPVTVVREEEAGAAWIGRAPEPMDEIGVRELADAFHVSDDSLLLDIHPPFCAAVQTSAPDTLWLISDPRGLHPLYYCHQDGLFAFCSKLVPLLKSGLVRWSLDPTAVLDLFTYEHVTGNRTLAKSVHVLPPGGILCVRGAQVQFRPYVELTLHSSPASGDDLVDALHAELARSVTRSMRDRSRVAITLSGGLDSRALLGCAVEAGSDLRTFTFGDPRCRDVVFAREIAHRAGVPNTAVEIDGSYLMRWLDHGIHVTGGMVSCNHFHITALADRIASEADLVLDGLGGDALTGAHLKPAMIAAWSSKRAVDSLYRQRATGWATADQRTEIFTPDFLTSVDYDPREAAEHYLRDLQGTPCWWGCHRFDLLERQRRFVQYGPHQIRPFLDVQTPFYTPHLIELMTAASVRDLFGQRAYIRMHARHLRLLAEIPDSALGVPVTWPASLRFAKRTAGSLARRLTPRAARSRQPDSPTSYHGWYRNELREFVEDRLAGSRPAIDGIIRSGATQRLVKEHMQGISDHSVKLGCLLTLDAWFRAMAEN